MLVWCLLVQEENVKGRAHVEGQGETGSANEEDRTCSLGQQ